MKIKIIACEVMKEELMSIVPLYDTEFYFVSMGLHTYPQKLNHELQKLLNETKGYERIILAFGLCGGAARSLKSEDTMITIPKVHDCIPLLLGSLERFESFKKQELGTFYHSCGWLQGEKTFILEYDRLALKYGEVKALKIMKTMYASYKKVLFIHTQHPQEESCIQKSKKVSEVLNLQFDTIMWKNEYVSKIVRGPWEEAEFITIPPGKELEDALFI